MTDKFFRVWHSAATLPALVAAYDVFDAARSYKASIERHEGTEMEGGESLDVAPLINGENGPELGEEVTLYWAPTINNFTTEED